MNWTLGFRRVLVVVSVLYWCAAVVVSVLAYQTAFDDAMTGAGLFADLIPQPNPRREATMAAGVVLGFAVIGYALAAAALATALWVIAGFRSPKEPQP